MVPEVAAPSLVGASARAPSPERARSPGKSDTSGVEALPDEPTFEQRAERRRSIALAAAEADVKLKKKSKCLVM